MLGVNPRDRLPSAPPVRLEGGAIERADGTNLPGGHVFDAAVATVQVAAVRYGGGERRTVVVAVEAEGVKVVWSRGWWRCR